MTRPPDAADDGGPHPPPAVGRPLRRDALRNREVVLGAARRMFAERGADCSFEDIARAAGVGVGTVYRRFPDRRSLIEAILEQRVPDVDRMATHALALEEPWAAAEAFIGTAARMQLEDRGLRELLHDHGFVSAGLAVLRERLTPAADHLAGRLRDDGASLPDLTGADLLALVRMLGSLTPERVDAADPPPPPAGDSPDPAPPARPEPPPEGFDRYLRLMLHALRAHPTPLLP
ncbi:helix-turn-helix domain containing protein [Arthrobacter agilis]|uniref:TetR/AcrR family transcriptional regulator n=1 Tax=Arthrobacter agilis TaxID=37921 RepID=UPI0023664D43|nr:TetR/AcrR family transcriptional regulator [Arthrobacter agilis]WDF33104.1 helix-turn-helix domain containing protein [Arthrobacter agilis]